MHLACLVVGAPLFRLLGAGEQMAQLHLAGHWYPTVVTLVIAGILFGWSAYALSGAGVLRKLPLRRTVLSVVTAIYIGNPPAFSGRQKWSYAAIASFMAGVMPPSAMLGRSWLYVQSQRVALSCTCSMVSNRVRASQA